MPNAIPKAFLHVVNVLERDRGQFNWKIIRIRNLDGLSLFVYQVHAKRYYGMSGRPHSGYARPGSIPSRQDVPVEMAPVGTAKDTTRRRKKKSPSKRARVRDRRKRCSMEKAATRKNKPQRISSLYQM